MTSPAPVIISQSNQKMIQSHYRQDQTMAAKCLTNFGLVKGFAKFDLIYPSLNLQGTALSQSFI